MFLIFRKKQGMIEKMGLTGKYVARYFENGKLIWTKESPNTVVTLGKNLALDTFLAGSGYTVTGPYMGLISSISWSQIVAGDTMSSHAGWHEAGVGTDYPLYNGNRKTCAWNAASGGSKALSAALSFVIETTGGTVKGAFLVFGTGASATKGDTGGTLLSAGLFIGGDEVMNVGGTLQVSYTMSA